MRKHFKLLCNPLNASTEPKVFSSVKNDQKVGTYSEFRSLEKKVNVAQVSNIFWFLCFLNVPNDHCVENWTNEFQLGTQSHYWCPQQKELSRQKYCLPHNQTSSRNNRHFTVARQHYTSKSALRDHDPKSNVTLEYSKVLGEHIFTFFFIFHIYLPQRVTYLIIIQKNTFRHQCASQCKVTIAITLSNSVVFLFLSFFLFFFYKIQA